MKKALLFFLCHIVSCLSLSATVETPNNNRHNSVKLQLLPSLEFSAKQGVSAPFAGMSGDILLVAGGCNFPGIPASEGGEKVFYKDVYALFDPLSSHAVWKKIGSLPEPLAYGVSATTSEGILCAGGTDGKKSSSAVFLLRMERTKLIIGTLPALPVPLDNTAGAYGGGYFYIAGGQSDGVPVNKVFRLKYPSGKEWEELPDYPGKPRVQPVAVVQNGATGPCLYLMGGFTPVLNDSLGLVHTDGLCYNPQTRQWKNTAPIVPHERGEKMALIGACGVSSGTAHLVFTGGVNASIFKAALNRPVYLKEAVTSGNDSLVKRLESEASVYLKHPQFWYRFNDELIIYHTLTDTWATEARLPQTARAGAAMVAYNGHWLVVNGESKPGVRSEGVSVISMESNTDFGMLNWIVLIVYLLGMLLLGYYFMKREANSDDFFKGGGRIPWWAAGISIYATMLSAITYMAIPAKAFATDWTYYPMLITILIVSFPVIKYFLPFFRRLNVTSAYEYLEHRFNYATRLMASSLFIVFMVARMALVLYLPSLALTTVTGIDIYICIILMGLVTIVYCTMGGVEAVVWGDVIQGIILVGGAFFAVAYLAFSTEGGLDGFVQIAVDNDKFRLFDWSLDYTQATFWVVILGGLANNLISYTSDQTVIQRYLTTKDERSAGRSILMNGIMSAFISVAFYAIGTGLYTFFKTHPGELDYTMTNADAIFPFFMMSQLPAGIAGLLIAAIFAATMSTISSNINSISTAFSVDVYKHFVPGTSDRRMLRVARITGIVTGLIGIGLAILMATWNILSLLDYFNTILGLLSSGLGGLFLMGIFFDRIQAKAALSGFCVGTAVVFYLNASTEVSFLLFGFVGMVVSVVVALILSLLMPPKGKQPGLTWKELNNNK